MNTDTSTKYRFILATLRTMAIGANILFIAWILRNGINENFEGTIIEKAIYIHHGTSGTEYRISVQSETRSMTTPQ